MILFKPLKILPIPQADTTLLAHFTKPQVTDHSEVTAAAKALCVKEALEMIC